jgi:transketolase
VLGDPPGGNPEVILIGSGSELSLAVQAHERLLAEGARSRVVSMPSWDIFEHQPRDYRESVLPPRVRARVAVEQGSTLGWDRSVPHDSLPRQLDSWLLPSSQQYSRARSTPSLCEHQAPPLGHK